ncbi:NAD-dependent epimerase/dehydratase family protein [Pseudobacillus sp. FSL P4-0506]|uniref:NAD-dependent epimerase/dehydratase family protein n=1 Tax=unclassified Pseudobacillus TaxID=2619284 RepID=UPI0030F7C083
MRVLVTGGAGFIGSHITEELLAQDHQVAVVDNLSSGKREQVPAAAVFYEGDVRKKELEEFYSDFQPDCVIHLAAQVSVAKSFLEPLNDIEENIVGTVNMLETCVKYGVKKVIFSSTAALYGNPDYLPVDERHQVNPLSFYGLSKKHAEAYIRLFSELHGLTYTILRYANVYGMRQSANGEAGVISIFIEKLLNSQPLTVLGDGNQTRDFIFVKDVAKANVAALTHGENEIINISTGKQTSVLDMVKEMNEIAGNVSSLIFSEERTGDIKASCLTNKKAETVLGWKPVYSLAEGLKETIYYYQKEMVIQS